MESMDPGSQDQHSPKGHRRRTTRFDCDGEERVAGGPMLMFTMPSNSQWDVHQNRTITAVWREASGCFSMLFPPHHEPPHKLSVERPKGVGQDPATWNGVGDLRVSAQPLREPTPLL